MTLTPEARAAELAGILWEDECGGVFGKTGNYQTVTDRIASAIRAAENDVLERARREIVTISASGSGSMRAGESDGFSKGLAIAVDRINSMKHKD